jgi:hypothetical protein
MIIILSLIAIGIVTSIAFWKWEDKKEDGVIVGIVCSVIIFIVCCLVWTKSYNEYLDARSFYTATKEQYFSAIEIYKDHALLDMSKASFTDFKYSGYQDNVGDFIKDLRNKIIEYNKTIIEKRIQGKNPVFSWFIIEPDDDMLIIKMKA